MATQAPRSLDLTGTQAAVYPSEAVLWAQGPPINDPTGQGEPDLDLSALAPATVQKAEATEAWLNEVLNGETSNGAYGERWVNNEVYGPQGFGDWNVQPFFTGHSQNVVSEPASEQGWGVGPARRWAHYPKVDSPNPFRNEGQHLRNGDYPYVSAESFLYERTQLAREQGWAPYKMRSPQTPVVPVATSVPHVQTVPNYPQVFADQTLTGDDSG